jgi:hypothetical protein
MSAVAIHEATGEIITQQHAAGAIESITRGEVDMQVSTAKRYPRSLQKFKQDALAMATLDAETAASCFYVLPRGGKNIEGPGVRLAEIVASCWGNLRCEARVVGEDGSFITAQGTAWDMERNVLVRMETQRRITDKNGRTFNDDMKVVTGNAAASIAFRNAVFKVVPSSFTRAIYEAARQVAVGDARTLSDRREKVVQWFNKAGITTTRILAMLGKPGIEDVDLADLTTLTGVHTAIQEGSATLDDAFPPEPLKDGTQSFGAKKAEPAEKAPPTVPRAPDEGLDEAEARWATSGGGTKMEPPPTATGDGAVDDMLAKIAKAPSQKWLKALIPNIQKLGPDALDRLQPAYDARLEELTTAKS